ncbi:hypothetical protein [Salinimicrobium sediminilitoris]|uniref:hypothetical protein n=1 Tax=Salinimicrobium sediminilitoris TaxID=2876715 RepID=UPI001E373BCD|nr:hypothetical protein [Salinimicrobium sediminilitoris]MCC8361090.1 hypothetical protein [Salinimicrobium sediminilitoris]
MKIEKWGEIPAQLEKGHHEIIRKSWNIYDKRWIGLLVLGAAVIILGIFFFYISTYINSKAFRGLGIMAGALVLNICMEFAMIKKRRFPINEALTNYRQQLISYYETRKYLHFIMAPLLLISYIYGFSMLLSIFEQELLGESHSYIIYLSWVVFFGLVVLIDIQLRKELEILKLLIGDNSLS